ncbi:MAG: flagellar hook-basal body complex protein FliE [Cryobacterium sp.]|uniref:flagellar hook-basal body complex protein FliE n=1 Tax=unclassified Cryobacterium TaxID=2649013 RepID=UPI0018CA4F16|nr:MULTISPECIES: flagellar hook-basal body complex protein FliE [unclassified Cryobacterium]MCY7404487.1 flagellar hook-basal body complex protein FliE [Cryobacterium sp.]MEC5153993.1 flagellar hook-basal body complex protein FliE [Cryobacterium sp. CAN_C3]
MPLGAIGLIQGVAGSASLGGVMGSSSTQAAQGTDGASFGNALSGAVDNLQSLSSTSNALAIQAVSGDLNDIHTATIASTRSAVTMELVAAIRNKGVDAFNEIMRMQA